MLRVRKDNPCPICGKPDYCLVSEDGEVAICTRISEGSQKVVGTKGAGWLHRLTDTPREYRSRPKPKPVKQVPPPDFFELVMQYKKNITESEVVALSRELAVSVESLHQLDIGVAMWWGKKWQTFSIRDGHDKIIGIRLRHGSMRRSVPGSRNGLYWPYGVKAESDNLLFLPEGYSDTCAMRDMGFDAVGRPNCRAGLDYIKAMIGGLDRQVVIMADKDEPKKRPDGTVYYPGIEGAYALAQELKSSVRSIRVVKPARYKDIRAWKQHGATKEQVMMLVDNGKFL